MPTAIEQLKPSLEIVPFEGMRAICALPGTRDVLVAHGTELSRIDTATRKVTKLRHSVKDRWGDPVSFCSLVPGYAATFNTAYAIELGARGAKAKASVPLRSETSTAGSVTVRASVDGAVAVACASDYLCSVTSPDAFVRDADNRFWGVAVAPDGKVIANGRSKGQVELRDPRTLEVRRVLEGLQAPALSMAFSPDGRWLVACDDTTRMRLWELATGRAIEVSGTAKAVHLAWFSDGSGFVAVELTRALVFFDAGGQYKTESRHHELETRYFLDGALVGDDLMIVPIEDRGLGYFTLGPRPAPPPPAKKAAAAKRRAPAPGRRSPKPSARRTKGKTRSSARSRG